MDELTENQAAMLDVIKYQAEAFNDENVDISDDTVLNTVLSETDGEGPSNSKNIFQGAILWTIKKNKLEGKEWPAGWLDLTARQLAQTIVMLLLLLMPFFGMSQLTVNLAASKTDLRNNAVTVGISYVKSIDSITKGKTYFWAGDHSSLIIVPDINIETGTADAFSSITAKITGLAMIFNTTTVHGLVTPDLHRGFHTFPISVGIETNNQFNFMNGILEAGWMPWLQTVKEVKMGVFLQAGNKFKLQSNPDSAIGGQVDGSAEAVGDLILRQRGFLSINSPTLVQLNFFKLGLIGSADEWYDFANGKFYYKLQATVRAYLQGNQYIDFIYQKGSGAPLFNNGTQFGLGLTLVL